MVHRSAGKQQNRVHVLTEVHAAAQERNQPGPPVFADGTGRHRSPRLDGTSGARLSSLTETGGHRSPHLVGSLQTASQKRR